MGVWSFMKLVQLLEIVVLAGVLILASAFLLAPVVNNMRETKRVMCSGSLNFLGAQLSSGPMVIGTTKSTSVDRNSYGYKALLQRTGLQHAFPQKTWYEGPPFVFDTVTQLLEWKQRTLIDEASAPFNDPTFVDCMDHFREFVYPGSATATLEALRDKTANSSIASCKDVKPYCYQRGEAGNVLGRPMPGQNVPFHP